MHCRKINDQICLKNLSDLTFRITVLLAMTLFVCQVEAKTPVIRLMDGTQARMIAEQMTLNGVPARVEELNFSRPLEQVIDYYSHRWERDGDVLKRQRGAWTVLATRKKDRFISLQLKPRGQQTLGLLTSSELPGDRDASYSGALSLPHGLKVLGWQKHRDAGQVAETITLSGDAPASHVVESLRRNFTSNRWEITLDQDARTLRNGHLLYLKRGDDDMRITIANDPQWSQDTLVYLILRRSQKPE